MPNEEWITEVSSLRKFKLFCSTLGITKKRRKKNWKTQTLREVVLAKVLRRKTTKLENLPTKYPQR